MWLYPAPVLLAIVGWFGIFLSTGFVPVVSSIVAMTIGLLVYMGRARMLGQWPFQQSVGSNGIKEITQ